MKQIRLKLSATVAIVLLGAGLVGVKPAAAQSGADEVMRVDEAYRIAKLTRDLPVLDRILADGFNETNQNGNSRDKMQTINLWRSMIIPSLTTDTFQVRITGGTAMVTGTQTEGTERMLFTRVYVMGSNGWQLLSSMQFRNPRFDQASR